MMRHLPIAVLGAVLPLLSAAGAIAETYRNPEYGFAVDLPS